MCAADPENAGWQRDLWVSYWRRVEGNKYSPFATCELRSARVSAKVYDALAQAAELTGATLNQFLVQSAYEKAQEVLEKERFIKLTARSASVFFDALEQPPPNKKLRSAVKSYRRVEHSADYHWSSYAH